MANILIIEPDILLGRTYKQALEAKGYKVAVVATAQEAIHACDTQTPDCVVLELHLTAHGGVEFLYEFRSYKEWLDIPIIIHSLVPPSVLQKYHTSLEQLAITKCLYKPATSLPTLVNEVAAATLVKS